MNEEKLSKKKMSELIELKSALEIVLTKYDNILSTYGASNFSNSIDRIPPQLRSAYNTRNEYRLAYDKIIDLIEIKVNQSINE